MCLFEKNKLIVRMETKELTIIMNGDGTTNKISKTWLLTEGNQKKLLSVELISYSLTFDANVVYPSVLLKMENDHATSRNLNLTKPGPSTPVVSYHPTAIQRLPIIVGQDFTHVDLNTPIVIFNSPTGLAVNETAISIEFLPEHQLEGIVGLPPVPRIAFLRFCIKTRSEPLGSMYNTHVLCLHE